MNEAQGNVPLNAGVSQGLPWLGASHDAHSVNREDAYSQFTKIDATALFTLPLPKVGRALLAYRGVPGGHYTNARCSAPSSCIWAGWTRSAAFGRAKSRATAASIRSTNSRG